MDKIDLSVRNAETVINATASARTWLARYKTSSAPKRPCSEIQRVNDGIGKSAGEIDRLALAVSAAMEQYDEFEEDAQEQGHRRIAG